MAGCRDRRPPTECFLHASRSGNPIFTFLLFVSREKNAKFSEERGKLIYKNSNLRRTRTISETL